MKNCALDLVNRKHNGINEILANINYFNRQATASSDNYNRACKLLKGTTYWLYDEATDAFGPSKFVGFKSMSFECYSYWVERAKTRKGKFLGGTTRKANENTLAKKFTPNHNLSKKLLSWGEKLFNSDIFKRINQRKWRFIEIPKKSTY
jgi:hypothetical protein